MFSVFGQGDDGATVSVLSKYSQFPQANALYDQFIANDKPTQRIIR